VPCRDGSRGPCQKQGYGRDDESHPLSWTPKDHTATIDETAAEDAATSVVVAQHASTSLAFPPHTDPDWFTTVVTFPSVVMVPTQVPSAPDSATSEEHAVVKAKSSATAQR
jgi:hypothetical protein